MSVSWLWMTSLMSPTCFASNFAMSRARGLCDAFRCLGREALDRLAEKLQPAFIAVLPEINVPGTDGLELLAEIKQRFPICRS